MLYIFYIIKELIAIMHNVLEDMYFSENTNVVLEFFVLASLDKCMLYDLESMPYCFVVA